jgi:6-pyruvoyltetrahydropterin/6-carboxytetrahydropterin synthase
MLVKTRVEGCKGIPEIMENVPVRLTKEFDFEAGHHLVPYEGKCEHSHGHSYHMEVTIEGKPGRDGLLIDFKELKGIVNEVIEPLDHNYLNNYFDFNTTCENMIRYLWVTIQEELPAHVALEEIKLWETRNSYATLTRKMVHKAMCPYS